MEPLIATVPFVKALEELVEAAEASGRKEELVKFSAHDARRELLEGRAAMVICWPTRSENEAVDRDGQITDVRFAPLPGATKFYAFGARQWQTRPDSENSHVPVIGISGRLGSVTRGSRHSKAAFDLLVWLTSETNGKAIAPKSGQTTMFRVSHLSDATQWVDPAISSDGAESYAEAIRASNASEVWLCAIRIPGRARYLAALDSAVHQAVAGMSPIDALREARQRWMEITDEIGVDAQQQAYRRSLGY
ncbi:MAG: hypothetical protein IH991_18630 [Planctomycetes bacterium]|nr:hypothetical protein [Planctomycetota bacterium]